MLTSVELVQKEVEALWKLYQDEYPQMGDLARSETVYKALLVSPITQIFRIDDGPVMIVGDMQAADSASLRLMIPDDCKYNLDTIKKDLMQIMAMFNLHRVFALLPEPAKDARTRIEDLGFVKEGCLREALRYDGEMTDFVIYGALRKELTNGTGPEENKPDSLAARTFGAKSS